MCGHACVGGCVGCMCRVWMHSLSFHIWMCVQSVWHSIFRFRLQQLKVSCLWPFSLRIFHCKMFCINNSTTSQKRCGFEPVTHRAVATGDEFVIGICEAVFKMPQNICEGFHFPCVSHSFVTNFLSKKSQLSLMFQNHPNDNNIYGCNAGPYRFDPKSYSSISVVVKWTIRRSIKNGFEGQNKTIVIIIPYNCQTSVRQHRFS